MGTTSIRFAQPPAARHQLVVFAPSVDDAIPADDPVRAFAALLEDVDWTPWELAYEGCGQPPIHPRYLAGAMLYGVLHKLRSTRELERAARKHLDFIWLLEGFTPDHSTFAGFRLRHAEAIQDLQRQVAQALVMRREQALLRLILDGTRLRADSDRHGARTAETLEKIIAELNRRLEALTQDETPPAPVQTDYLEEAAAEPTTPTAAPSPEAVPRLEAKRAQYQRALEAAHARDARARQHDGKNAKPVRVPVTDPESHITPNKEGGFAPNYTPIAAIEPQSGAIVHADVLDGSDEASAVMPAVAAAQALTECPVDSVLADGGFAAGPVLEALDAAGIEAYMPTRSAGPADNPAIRPDPSQPVAEAERDRLPRHGAHLDRAAFIYDPSADVYYCPMGHPLAPYKHGKSPDGVPYVYYQCHHGRDCPLAPVCIKGKEAFRSLTRDAYEPLREATAQRMATPEGRAIYRMRAPGIEGVFGVIKSVLDVRRFTLRGLAKVRIEWSWICTAYNLKKLLRLAVDSARKALAPSGRRSFCAEKRLRTHSRPVSGATVIHQVSHPMLRLIRTIGYRPYAQSAAAA